MKKMFALAVALASAFILPAFAQEALDITPQAIPTQNFIVIHDTRWFPQATIADLSTNSSVKIPAVMGGNLIEGWLVTNSAIVPTTPLLVYVSISKRNGPMQPVGSILVSAGGKTAGQSFNGIFAAGAGIGFNEGDTIWVSNQSTSTGTSIGTVILRVAN